MKSKNTEFEKKKPVGIRLRPSLIDNLKKIADAQNLRQYQTLIDDVLTDYVENYLKKHAKNNRGHI